MRFAKGLETWIKNRLPDSLRDRLNNNKYRYIIKKENLSLFNTLPNHQSNSRKQIILTYTRQLITENR